VPKDWAIWEDIVRKVYARYEERVDWVEIWNEVEYWGDLTGSPYSNKEDFLVDYFYHTVSAIRAAGGAVPTGGFAFAHDEPQMFQNVLNKLVKKYGRSWTDENFDFYSVHHYGSDPGNIDTSAIKASLQTAGLKMNKPIFVDEWNYTTDWNWGPGELTGPRAIGFVGKTLTRFVKDGVNATYFCGYPSNYQLSDTVYEDGASTLLAFYKATGNEGVLLPQSYPFRILSNRLALGKGNYTIAGISNQTVIDACAAINCSGRRIALIANYYDNPNRVIVTVRGLPGARATITEYWAAA
jgi:hypothetical protein